MHTQSVVIDYYYLKTCEFNKHFDMNIEDLIQVVIYIDLEDITRVVISYEIHQTSLCWV